MIKGIKLGLMLIILVLSLCVVPQARAVIMTRLDIILAGEEVSEVVVGSSFDLNVIVYETDPFAFYDEVVIFGFITTLSQITAPSQNLDSLFTINEIIMPDGIEPDLVPNMPVSYPNQYISGIANFTPPVAINFGEDTLLTTLNITANEIGSFTMGIESDLSFLDQGLFTFFSDVDLTTNTRIDVTTTSVPDADVALLILTSIGILGLLERKKIYSRIRF